MNKHTKGPWHVVLDDTGGPFTGWPSVEAPEDVDTAIVHRAGFNQEHWGDLSQRECVANARLIAEAPNLLAALRTCIFAIGHGRADLLAEAAAIANRVIAKAEGRTP